MRAFNKNKGFTLIELLLVIVIIGLMLAVIVPRAWRANIDTKYGLVRMNCSELASFGMEWAEKAMMAQDEDSFCTLANYIATLAGNDSGIPSSGWASVQWVADTAACNWNGTAGILPGNRLVDGANVPPEDTVQQIVPPDKLPRNPFNGVSAFALPNFPISNPVTGAIACGGHGESNGQWIYFAFLFQGTDSTTTAPPGGGSNGSATAASFHAGQSAEDIPGLRNGVFFARVR